MTECALVAASFIGGFVGMGWYRAWRRQPRRQPEVAQEWRVEVGPAKQYVEGYDFREGRLGMVEPVAGEYAVRLRRGKESQPFATVKLASDDFEAELHALVARAEERCTALNAVHAEVGG